MVPVDLFKCTVRETFAKNAKGGSCPISKIVECIKTELVEQTKEIRDTVTRTLAACSAMPEEDALEEAKKAIKAMKEKLPIFTAAGVFDGALKNEEWSRDSRLISLDFDKVKPADMAELRDKLMREQSIVMLFTSPSGFGIKAVVYVESDAPFLTRWHFVTEYFQRLDPRLVNDKQTKNVSRIAYLCHDPDVYYNANAVALTMPDGQVPPPAQPQQPVVGSTNLPPLPPPTPTSPPLTPDRAAVIERAKKYIATMPHSIQGENGSGALYAVAVVLVHGFCLTEDEAYPLMESFPATPAWSEKEIRHKLDDAANKPHEKPKGWLLNQVPMVSSTQSAPSNPSTFTAADDTDFAVQLLIASGDIARMQSEPAISVLAKLSRKSKELFKQRMKEIQSIAGGQYDAITTLIAKENTSWAKCFDLTYFTDIVQTETQWIWKGVFPRGSVSMFGGKQGLGKSFIVTDVAARVSTGRGMPGDPDDATGVLGKVLIMAREDDPGSVLKPRLESAGADMTRVAITTFTGPAGCLDIVSSSDALMERIKAEEFDIIFVDTFAAFASAETDANAAQDVRKMLDCLNLIARTTGAAVVVTAHLRKVGQGDGDPMDAIAGSTQMTAGVRVAIIMEIGHNGDRWFHVEKINLAKKTGLGWTWCFHQFSIDPKVEPRIIWKVAGPEYATFAADKQSKRASVDPIQVRAAMVSMVQNGPITTTVAAQRLWKALRTQHPRLTQKQAGDLLRDVMADIVPNASQEMEVGAGPNNSVLLGKPGSMPESTKAKAKRLAKVGMSVRALAEAAGCSKDTASAVLGELAS